MFGLIKKIFFRLLTSIVSASSHKKYVSLSNDECMIQPTLTNLHPNEYSQELHYYPFAVNLDRCVGSLMTYLINYAFQTKQIVLNLIVLNMITGINGSKTLIKHLSCKCKC